MLGVRARGEGREVGLSNNRRTPCDVSLRVPRLDTARHHIIAPPPRGSSIAGHPQSLAYNITQRTLIATGFWATRALLQTARELWSWCRHGPEPGQHDARSYSSRLRPAMQ